MAEDCLLIVDAHLDLAMNAIQVNRDLTQPAATVRTHDPEPVMRSFGSCTVTFPELRRGRVGIVFGTVISRLDPNDNWSGIGMYTQEQCYAIGRGHLAYYHALEREGVVRLIRTAADLEDVLTGWNNPSVETPIGLVVSMECADPIQSPDQVAEWYDSGVRTVSLSHYGVGHYACGTGTEGGLLAAGKTLLRTFREVGIIVDMTHLTDHAFWEVLEIYDGPIMASHQNCRALVPGQRQLSDDMIKAIVERRGVIGAALDAWMLDPEWRLEIPPYEQTTKATLETVADHIDHIAQLVGNARYCALGSDLDGGFGAEESPRDLNTIADLQKLSGVLRRRGYRDEDVQGILAGNWIRFLKEAWSC